MELDDQLAALAAGELDDGTARALEARAANDPALAARLARFRRLEATLRDGAGPVAMDPAAVRRMDATLDEALAALPDAPLLAHPGAAAAAGTTAAATARGGDGGQVVDLSAARARRTPRWIAGAAAAAAVLAGVVVIGPGVVGGGDDAEQDTVALDSADDGGERMDDGDEAASMESAPAGEAQGAETEESTAEGSDGAAEDDGAPTTQDEAGADGGAASDEAGGADDDAARDADTLAGVPVQPYDSDAGTLSQLLTSPQVEDARSGVGGDGAAVESRRAEQQAALAEAGDDPLARCATTALDLEPAGALVLLGVGSHEGVGATAAVLVRPDRSVVALALAADGCEVLGRAEG